MEHFRKVMEGAPSVAEKLCEDNTAIAERNTEVVIRLMEIMKNSMMKGIALRGHRDDGTPSIDNEDFVNMGNFKSDVVSRAKFDPILRDHLEKSKESSYASYMSKYAQKDMIECILHDIQLMILEEARDQAGKMIFAVSADEVTDCSNVEQLAIVIRTVNKEGNIHERLIEYIDLDSITSESVTDAILQCLKRHNLRVSDLRAQTYDGASNMSGRVSGVQARIKELQPLAVYTHCASHRLNLALNATSSVQEFRILMENVKKLGLFFKYSPKRSRVLEGVLKDADPPVSAQKVR